MPINQSADSNARLRVLVADDESHILNVVSLKLRKAGYDVTTATDGASALAKAREVRPAVLVTDFHMPRMNGLELCQALREDPEWDVPAVLLTARDSDLPPGELEAGRVVEVINKPFSPRSLVQAIERHLNHEAKHQLNRAA